MMMVKMMMMTTMVVMMVVMMVMVMLNFITKTGLQVFGETLRQTFDLM